MPVLPPMPVRPKATVYDLYCKANRSGLSADLAPKVADKMLSDRWREMSEAAKQVSSCPHFHIVISIPYHDDSCAPGCSMRHYSQ